MRRAAKVDRNQAEIIDALREAGALVHPTHQLGGGFPDLLVGWGGRLLLIEIKGDTHKRFRGPLTEDETAFHDRWTGYPVYVVFNPLQALVLLGFEAKGEDDGS